MATVVYRSLFCSLVTPLSGIVDCLPSVFLAPNMQGEIFINQITSDIYTYDQANKLIISMDDTDQNTAVDLQLFLKDKDQKWLKVVAPSWVYWMSTNSSMLYSEGATKRYFYKDITSEDRLYMFVCSLWPGQVTISLTSQDYLPRQRTTIVDPPLVGIEPQMQSTTLQNEHQPETESRASTSSGIDENHDIIVTE